MFCWYLSKYVRITPSNYKIGITVTKAFQKLLDDSNCKPNKMWIGTCSEFSSRSTKYCLQDNDIEIYITHNEGKCINVKRFTGIVKNKVDKNMSSISKNVCTDKLIDIADKYNKTYQRKIKVKHQYIYILLLMVKIMINILNLKMVIMWEYQNITTFSQKHAWKTVLKKIF